QRTASPTLLFPLPLGPTMAVIPLWNSNVILFAKDLNPCTSILFRYISHLFHSSAFSEHSRLPAVLPTSWYVRSLLPGPLFPGPPLRKRSCCRQVLPPAPAHSAHLPHIFPGRSPGV